MRLPKMYGQYPVGKKKTVIVIRQRKRRTKVKNGDRAARTRSKYETDKELQQE